MHCWLVLGDVMFLRMFKISSHWLLLSVNHTILLIYVLGNSPRRPTVSKSGGAIIPPSASAVDNINLDETENCNTQ